MKKSIRSAQLATWLLLAPTAVLVAAQPAAAQQRAVVGPQIVSMAVHSESGLAPGATLTFTVQGTPNARSAWLTLANGINVPLRQISTGNYEGTYTVRRSDNLDPAGVVKISMRHGNRLTERSFSYPASFRAMAMGSAPATRDRGPGGPLVERFVMRHDGSLEPGSEVRFRVRGEEGARVWMEIPGVERRIRMQEVRPGVYEGSYTLRKSDRPDALFGAVATMRLGDRTVTANIDREVVRPDQWGQR